MAAHQVAVAEFLHQPLSPIANYCPKQARPGANYKHSQELLKQFKARYPKVSTKSGLMVGLGETDEEILEFMRNLCVHNVEILTIAYHLPMSRYVPPETLTIYETDAYKMWSSASPDIKARQSHGRFMATSN